MGKIAGLLKRIKNWMNNDKNKYLIHNDPSIFDPYHGLPEQLRPYRNEISREKLHKLVDEYGIRNDVTF